MTKERVLIVDDEIDVLDLCKRILATQGYRVTSAPNGYEAIKIAQNQPFDLLLTDIKMPGISGLEIAQQLKEIDPTIICVTMTGFSTMDMAINALKLGIDEFILKPFTPKELSAAISKALEKERLRKENFRLRSLIPLFELNKTLMGTVDEDDLIDRVLEIAQQETGAFFVGLYLVQDDTIVRSLYHDEARLLTAQQKEAVDTLAKLIITEEGAPTLSIEPSHETFGRYLEAIQAISVLTVPLKSKNVKLGLLVAARASSRFAPGDIELLSVLCGQAGVALENARLFTEIQAAYRQLQILDHMKSEFINIAAHELRTPLAILMGYATVLEEELTDAQQFYIANITRNAMRLRSLIDDMLNLQYLESGYPSLARDELELRELVEEITQDVSLLVEEKQLDIRFDIPADFPKMIIDRQKFDLILMNLIHNAVKFTPEGGRITICAQAGSDQFEMAVNNTGSIIPQEKLNQIFERFYQVEATLTRAHGGAGLGLSIVRGMVEVCGGKISVKSSKEEGTTFTFNLPLNNTNLKPRKLKL